MCASAKTKHSLKLFMRKFETYKWSKVTLSQLLTQICLKDVYLLLSETLLAVIRNLNLALDRRIVVTLNCMANASPFEPQYFSSLLLLHVIVWKTIIHLWIYDNIYESNIILTSEESWEDFFFNLKVFQIKEFQNLPISTYVIWWTERRGLNVQSHGTHRIIKVHLGKANFIVIKKVVASSFELKSIT